ncbi:VOC family protein [Nocardiopsis sp. ATB16-24]|uniref:VOC family protein n=1 Tax=Nocardiopsis sp. ATB16-24 TaxID=3019555 RepID=UPI00255514AE|nr:VOC family protein [Nocardiopsis sp. ATB16-24]
MSLPNLDSMLLATTDPDRLRDWYVAVLEPQEHSEMDGYRVLRFGAFHLLIDRRQDVGPKAGDPARMILNFDVEDARAVAARMDERDTPWPAPLEDREGSLFGTAIDPDGNYVQIIQLSEKHRAEMKSTE